MPSRLYYLIWFPYLISNYCNGQSGCSITDTHGCCISGGFFWCGSSGRCTFGDDVCEDGLGDSVECSLTTESASFDLSPLQLQVSQLDHVVVDANSVVGDTQTYIFNFCANAITPDACTSTSGGGGEVISDPSPAYQLYSEEVATGGDSSGKYGGDKTSTCYRLGGSVYDSTATTIELYSGSAQNEFGISVKYSGGNSCDDGFGTRGFQINVLCDNTQTQMASSAQVQEEDACTYVMTLFSVYGCPLECPRNDQGEVCSNHGHCSSTDLLTSTNRVMIQCSCDLGWGGDTCSDEVEVSVDDNTIDNTIENDDENVHIYSSSSSPSSSSSSSSSPQLFQTLFRILFQKTFLKWFVFIIIVGGGFVLIFNQYLKQRRNQRISRLSDLKWVQGKQLLYDSDDDNDDYQNGVFSNGI